MEEKNIKKLDLKEELKSIRERLTEYQDTYYKEGRSLVSDAEYDRLFDYLVQMETKYPELKTPDSPTERVGSDLSSEFSEVEHTIPVLSLDKAYSVGEVLKFVKKAVADSGSNVNPGFVLEEKIDGFSLVLYYRNGLLEQAVTRGNGHVGNDVTANVKTIKSIPLRLKKPVTLAVRGEVFLYKKDFEKINKTLEEPFANPRNLAAGTIRRIKSSDTARVPLTMFCYEGFWEGVTNFTTHIEILTELKALGLPVDPSYSYYGKELHLNNSKKELFTGICYNNIEDIEKDIKKRTETRKDLPYEIDGLVIKIDNLAQREVLGYTQHHPRWAIAYKFESPEATSVVKEIDVQVGRTGRITPMARIKAVELAGSTIRNVTLHNQEYVDELEISVGDTVSVSKRGDVIPAVEAVLEKNSEGNTTYKIPSVCPVCGGEIEKRGSHHFCKNYNCPAQVKGRLEFFSSKSGMDITGLGPSIIKILYNLGYVRKIQDIYTFNFMTLLETGVEGFGVKKVDALEKAIAESKKQPFSRILASLGISEFGSSAIDLVIKAGFNSFDKLRNATEEELSSISGIGPVTAGFIVSAFKDPKILDVLYFFQNAGFKMQEEDDVVAETDGIFAGETWCVTGTFKNFKPRDLAMAEIKKRGGKEVAAVSKKTTCLLAGENAGSKLEKARALGVRVVLEDEFLEMIGKNVKENLPDDSDNLFQKGEILLGSKVPAFQIISGDVSEQDNMQSIFDGGAGTGVSQIESVSVQDSAQSFFDGIDEIPLKTSDNGIIQRDNVLEKTIRKNSDNGILGERKDTKDLKRDVFERKNNRESGVRELKAENKKMSSNEDELGLFD